MGRSKDELEEMAGLVEYLVEAEIEDGKDRRCDATFVEEPTLAGLALRAVVLIDGEPPQGEHRIAVLGVLARLTKRLVIQPRDVVPS